MSSILKRLILVLTLSWSPSFSSQMHIKNQDPESLIIAIIDTGADLNHEKFKSYLWSNPGEMGLDAQGRDKSSNGIDDDANGFIDDVHGWDFVNDNSKVLDRHGHGTHIAGIIVDEISKKSPVKLMILKYFEDSKSESFTLQASNRAFAYAIQMGARIINYSGGGDSAQSEERRLVKLASERKILIVAASGNEGRSNDQTGFYPASYGFKNIISVASANSEGKLLSSSNYGKNSVDVIAPGKDILSSLPYGRYGRMSGTSQATAIVTGVLASILVQSPHLALTEAKERLINTARFSPHLYDKLKHPAIPDRKRALHMRDEFEFNKSLRISSKRIKEVFDDPLAVPLDRTLSSDQGPTVSIQE